MSKITVTMPEKGSPAYGSAALVLTVTNSRGELVELPVEGNLELFREIQFYGGCHNHEVVFSPDAWGVFQRGIMDNVAAAKIHINKGLECLKL